MQNRYPTLGQPVGKGVEGSTPILLAKLSLDQEIEVVCKAYKVSDSASTSLGDGQRTREDVMKLTLVGYWKIPRQVVTCFCCWV